MTDHQWRGRFCAAPNRVHGRWIRGAFELLPDAPVVAVGAGYNTTYELLTLGLPFALVPLEKRFDDPWRRAGLLGRALHTRGQLGTFLETHGYACHP
ncbi:MAG: hypothetical protein AAFX99_32675 [Myxococcota bacterium]